MAKQNDAGDAAAEEIVPETEIRAPQGGETEAQAPVAEQPADAPTDAPAPEDQPTPDDQPHTDQDAAPDDHKDGPEPLTADAVKAIIDEALAPLFARLAALEKTADTNEVNKLAGRLRHIEQRVRGFF